MTDIERLELYYACQEQEGNAINWATGEITPRTSPHAIEQQRQRGG